MAKMTADEIRGLLAGNPIEQIQLQIQGHLNDIKKCFVDGVELTFVMRDPKSPESYMVLSNDDLSEVVKTLQRAKI